MRLMRRLLTLLLMCLVPLQYTWAVAGLHAHAGEPADGESLPGTHLVAATVGHDSGDSVAPVDAGEEPHCHFCHHLPSLLLLDSGPAAGIPPSGRPAAGRAAHHASYIPPVRDRPPRGQA